MASLIRLEPLSVGMYVHMHTQHVIRTKQKYRIIHELFLFQLKYTDPCFA